MTQTLFINGRFYTQVQSGMQRYARCLVDALDVIRANTKDWDEHPITILVPDGKGNIPDFQTIHVKKVGRLSGHAWEQIELFWASRKGTLLSLISAGPILHSEHIVAMHDAAIFAKPKHFSKTYRMFHKTLRPLLARRAKTLITISEFSRTELSRYCKVQSKRFAIIPDAAEHILHLIPDPDALTRFDLKSKKYFLCVGNQSPNKNIAAAVRAFQAARLEGYELAIAGGGAAKIFGTEIGIQGDGIKTLGRVTDEELRALYEGAAAFLFPSLYEGFGVPPLEAMSLGCPVISSPHSAMPEVLGQAALFVDPDNVEDFQKAISKVINNTEYTKQLIEAGKKKAMEYSWENGATTLIQLIGQHTQAGQ